MNCLDKKKSISIEENNEIDETIIKNAIKDIEYSPSKFARIPSVSHLPEVAKKIHSLAPTMTECRIPIFVPLTKVSETSDIYLDFKKNKGVRKLDTPWGKAFVRGRVLLTQTHRDILDSAIICAEKIGYSQIDGSIQVYFYANKALEYYSDKKGSRNTEWLVTMLEQIRDTVIKYQSKSENGRRIISFVFNIIRRIVFSESNGMFFLEFDPSYVAFYQTEMSVCYKSIMPEILSCESGIVKSMIRFFVTHKEITIGLDKLLESVGCPLDLETQSRKYYRVINSIEESRELLEGLGITYNKKERIFTFKRQDNVFIQGSSLQSPNKEIAIKALSKSTQEKNEWQIPPLSTLKKSKSSKAKVFQEPSLFPEEFLA